MPELILLAAAILGVVAIVFAVNTAPVWHLKARIHARLRNQKVSLENEGEESAVGGFLVWFVDRKLFVSDFRELEPSLDAAGKDALTARRDYLLWCWLFPLVITIIAFLRFDFISAALCLLASFYVPRRLIRASGVTAEKLQNREAIELCQLTRMLMEAGLSPERSLRLISHQARDIMPRLIGRIDRFNRVMESGADRTAALDELGRNRNLTVLRSYVALMKQSGTLGSKVSSGLDQIVQEAQHEERSKLKEETNKIGARMTIIMMIFMLPSLFMLIGGPAVLSVLDAFQR
ncbi:MULTISPECIES: type II secretion system F family protein [Marinobacter]|uniref:type II secretion system F family protein n=1 Tax=Marinobacter TaxID=2742 RepID=UPI001C949F66|nr:type II secretion system F family protein [Marinobacter nauticus]MBY5937673.1 type II secretion system F family protein [Marinobacter nauticus]MBY5954901.1 type II secretion system F family protein [Marinobacter nauticus]MBY5961310.1 type II secretion system F family protein [Marinobacter nauticus]MBY6008694.1 type II secretion system F family protein [Marinobacter nauticus]MBY6192861.1 type II secretion system F family protein [Marinobacter nauticus]